MRRVIIIVDIIENENNTQRTENMIQLLSKILRSKNYLQGGFINPSCYGDK